MKPLKPPGYIKRHYTAPHRVPGCGSCPQCGQFSPVQHTATTGEFSTQYRACGCGNRFQTVIRRG